MTATMSTAQAEIQRRTREGIRIALSMPAEYKLADIIQALADARQHRLGIVRACAECAPALEHPRPSGDLCERHNLDADQAILYDELQRAFTRARTDKRALADITRVILTDDPPSLVEHAIAEAAVAAVSIDRALEAIIGPAPAAGNAALRNARSPGPVGFVYVIEFSNGTVKVGRTENPDSRMSAHAAAGKKFGALITDKWLSPQHSEWLANETRLKGIAAELGGTVAAQEYFTGVGFADVVARAQELTFTPALVDA